MNFKNETTNTLEFDLRGDKYKVKPGETVHIPDRVAYAVKKMGLPLTSLDVAAAAEETADPDDTIAAWRARAEMARRRVVDLEEQTRRMSDRYQSEQADNEVRIRELTRAESEARASVAAFQAQVTELQGQLGAVTKDRDDLLESATRADAPEKNRPTKPR